MGVTPRTDLPLPRDWPTTIKSALLHATALAHRAAVASRGWAANSRLASVRAKGDAEAARAELELLRQEIAIRDARSSRVPPKHRPHYTPEERLLILALRAAGGWTAHETARRFQVTPLTIASWTKRAECGGDALLATPLPVNKIQDFVALVVERVKVAGASFGRRRIASILARAGLSISASSVRRLLQRGEDRPPPKGRKPAPPELATVASTSVIAKGVDHVWSVDLTVVPTLMGFWVPWFPFAALPVWPFAWTVLVVVDHFSRRLVHTAAFRQQPTAAMVTAALDAAIAANGCPPAHLVSDRGSQFQSDYNFWCKSRQIKPRWGAIGKHGSIAVTERTIRSLKYECLRPVQIPLGGAALRALLASYRVWFNDHRPHATLRGLTPSERASGLRRDVGARPVVEARARAPANDNGRGFKTRQFDVYVRHVGGLRVLPTFELRVVA